MRAVIVSEYGGSPHVVDLPQPEVEAGQVLIKVLGKASPPSTSSFRRPPSCCIVSADALASGRVTPGHSHLARRNAGLPRRGKRRGLRTARPSSS